MRTLLLTSVITVGWSAAAHANYILTLTQDGPDIVALGAGSIDTSSLQFAYGFLEGPMLVGGPRGVIYTGQTRTFAFAYHVAAAGPFPINFGPGVYTGFGYPPGTTTTTTSFTTGNIVGISEISSTSIDLGVDAYYVSGTELFSNSVFNNVTFEQLNLAVGTYVFAFDNQTFTVAIGTPASVPEPFSLALLSIGMLGVAAARWQRAL